MLDWENKFKDLCVDLSGLNVPQSWNRLIEKYGRYIECELTKMLRDGELIIPYPDDVFRAFRYVNPKSVKVVILGQDPYSTINGKPFANGFAFSVDRGIYIPNSLHNIYLNLLYFGNIRNYPKNGDLTKWAVQKCLLLNTSLTVSVNEPGSHRYIWLDFINNILHCISNNNINVVFMLWGKPAIDFYENGIINDVGNKIIMSSHPSRTSYSKKEYLLKSGKKYYSFNHINHFGIANKYLVKHNKKPINWNLD